jgi:hypothetical protein
VLEVGPVERERRNSVKVGSDELPEFGHVRQLVDGGYCPDLQAAERFVADLGVRCVRGVFSRRALLAALEEGRGAVAEGGHGLALEKVLTEGLGRFGLHLVGLRVGRTTSATVAALDAPMVVTTETKGGPLVIDAEKGASARIYVTDERRTGQAYFLAGLDRPSTAKERRATALYLFVLTSEDRFWVARREDLETYDAELREAAKGQRGRRRYEGRTGFAPYTKRPGYIRVWVGLGGLPAIEPGLRIADASGRLAPERMHWIGGRP